MSEELEKRAHDAIIRARVQLLLKHPFFGVLATYLEPKPTQLGPYCGGMGTDGKFLYYQPDKIVNIPPGQIEGIISHELMHVALGHLWRRDTRDPFRWNLATDYAVNPIVRKSFSLPEWVLYDKRYEGKCAEEIYELLSEYKCPKCGCKRIRGAKYKSTKRDDGDFDVEVGFRCDGCGHGWEEYHTVQPEDFGGYPVPFEEVEGDFPTTLDDHSVWDRTKEANGVDPKTKAERLEQEWKRRTVRAAQIAKNQGRLPAGLERFIEDLLYPKLGWRQLLWQYTTKVRGMRPDWRKPSKKWIQYGIYYPTKRERRLNAAVAVDTSGSISEEELKEFLSEIRGILSTFRSFRVRLLACDAEVHTDITATSLEDFDSFRVNIKGGGGTSFIPVFEAIKNEKVQVLVYLTDGYGDYPSEAPGFDVVWVISRGGDPKRPPFGRVIELR
ncbi:MAG: hypothetical protein H5T49_04580 [Hadesarchaea archaeon]|nr:hypothetical protein [Hadesarchaea archaeon]